MLAALLWLFRALTRWMHRHLFKVGWLITQDYGTTTVLYYTLFFPGVLLYEVLVWLVAGLLNVRATRAHGVPPSQEIGELRLTFVRLAPSASPLKLAIIHSVPVAASLMLVGWIAWSRLNIEAALAVMASGAPSDVAAGLRLLTSAPDFGLWLYIVFALTNTAVPELRALRGWRSLVLLAVVVALFLALLGAYRTTVLPFLAGPVAQAVNTLSTLLTIMIAINASVGVVLAVAEDLTERITGRSAAFRRGRMIALSRAERLEQQARELRRQRTARARQRAERAALRAGPPSVYRLPLPVPGPPGKEPVTELTRVLGDAPAPRLAMPALTREARAGATQIEGTLGDDDPLRRVPQPRLAGRALLPAPDPDDDDA